MDDLLSPVKTVRKVHNNIQKFESLRLEDGEPVRQHEKQSAPKNAARTKRSILEIDTEVDGEPLLQAATTKVNSDSVPKKDLFSVKVAKHRRHDSTAFLQQAYLKETPPSSLSDNAREILKSQPNHEDLKAVLEYLQYGIDGRHDFDVRVTGPKSASIINVLATVTVPDVWTNIRQKEVSEDEAQIKKTLIASLSSVAGLGALLAQIKYLSASRSNIDILADTIMVLGDVLKSQKSVLNFINDAKTMYARDIDRRLFWQEMVSLLAGSKILSIVSQAFDTVKSNPHVQSYSWLGNGAEYVKWLAKNITAAAQKLHASDTESWKCLGQLVKRGLSLGHRGTFVLEIYTRLLLASRALWTPVHMIMNSLESHDQKMFFDAILSDLARNYLNSPGGPNLAYTQDPKIKQMVAGAAALITKLVENNEILKDHIENWLTGRTSSSAVVGLASRRALISVFGQSEDYLQRILEKSLTTFGDTLQIQHASIMQQEATAQTILLTVGYLNRIDVRILKNPSISVLVMNAVSNRLAASVPRARLLGMIVGTAISKFTDKKENVIDFGTEEMDSDDVKMWFGLTEVDDQIGDVVDLKTSEITPNIQSSSKIQKAQKTNVVRESIPAKISKMIAIEEVLDSSDSEDDDLIPYQKPDSDPEDSEDDATLINRDKPSAPIYIVDLIKQLQATDKPDIISLALKTAPSLIRRKATFGTELTDNIHTLVTTLINLQEQGTSDFEVQKPRLESLIECLVAKPEKIGPALADTYFQGDFSLSQRITILTAIGLATRRMAGYDDDASKSRSQTTDTSFPSKRLPAHLEPSPSQSQVTPTNNAISMLTETAARDTIRPMATSAADQLGGPSVLQIRNFSSRPQVAKRAQEKRAARSKTVPRNLHKILVETIYIPLCSRMNFLFSHHHHHRIRSGNSSRGTPNTTLLHTSTLRLFLQSLTLVLYTLGPSASLHLPALTHETLLLLNLHTVPNLASDPAILPSILHLFLTLLDLTVEAGVSAQERLMNDFGPQVVELVNWVGDVHDVPEASSDGGNVSWSVLKAGIQVKWYEIRRRFQSRVLGLTLDQMDELETK